MNEPNYKTGILKKQSICPYCEGIHDSEHDKEWFDKFWPSLDTFNKFICSVTCRGCHKQYIIDKI